MPAVLALIAKLRTPCRRVLVPAVGLVLRLTEALLANAACVSEQQNDSSQLRVTSTALYPMQPVPAHAGPALGWVVQKVAVVFVLV